MDILIIKPSSLGDIFHTLPAVRLIKDVYPHSQITWIMFENFCEIAALFADVDQVLEFRRNEWANPRNFNELYAFIKDLRSRPFDWVFDFQGLLRSGLWTWLCSSPNKVGFADARECASTFYTIKVDIPKYIRHAVDRNLYLVNAVFGTSASYQAPRFREVDVHKSLALRDRFNNDRIWVAVAPGARWKSKRWPPEFFMAVIRHLLDDKDVDIQVWLLGAPDEMSLGRRIAHAINSDRIVDLIGKTDLISMFALLRQTKLLLTNDSGPMHIAAALGVPTVSMFGPTDPRRTGPYGHGNKVFQTRVSCSPCYFRTCPLSSQLCLDDVISAPEVGRYILSEIRVAAISNRSL